MNSEERKLEALRPGTWLRRKRDGRMFVKCVPTDGTKDVPYLNLNTGKMGFFPFSFKVGEKLDDVVEILKTPCLVDLDLLKGLFADIKNPQSYGRGAVVGAVTCLQAFGYTCEEACKILKSILPRKFDVRILPISWKKQLGVDKRE